MIFNIQLNSNLQYRRDDKPLWSGSYTTTSGLNIIHLLAYITTSVGVFQDEIAVDVIDTNNKTFEFNQKDAFDLAPLCGNIGFIGLIDNKASATLTHPVTDAVGQISALTTPTGFISSGYCRIEDEICTFTYSGGVFTLTARGLYGTTAVSHSASTPIKFSTNRQMANPKYKFEVFSKEDN